MASVNTTSSPELDTNQIEQTVSRPVGLVQGPDQPTASDSPAAATTPAAPPNHDPSNGPSPLQGRDEVNSGGVPHHPRSLHGPALSTPQPFIDDTEVQQLRRIVASQHAQLLSRDAQIASQQAQIASQRAHLFQYQQNFPAIQFFPMVSPLQTARSQNHAEILNTAIVDLEAAIAHHVPANAVPPLGANYYHGFDMAERLRPGHFSRIGAVRTATSKLLELRAPPAPAFNRRAERTADNTRPAQSNNPASSSQRTAPRVPATTSSTAAHPASVQTPTNESGDETEEEDWKGKGGAALRQPDTVLEVPEHPYAPTAPRPNTQGSQPSDGGASASSSQRIGGPGGRRKRGRKDDDEAAGGPTKAKKSK